MPTPDDPLSASQNSALVTEASSLTISSSNQDSVTPSDSMEDENLFTGALAELTTRLADIDIVRSFETIVRGEAASDEGHEQSDVDEDELETAFADGRAPNHTEVVPLDETREALKIHSQEKIHEVIRNALFSDPYIRDTADELSIPDDEVMSLSYSGDLVFVLKADYFNDRETRHEDVIGTQFHRHKDPHVYQKDDPRRDMKAGDSSTRYNCQRGRGKRVFPNRIPGGPKGMPRKRQESILCKCESFFRLVLRPWTLVVEGRVEDVCRIEYHYGHNHVLGKDGSIGTQQKSKAIRNRIKAMLLRGMSISAVMNQLTMDHARFTRLFETSNGSPRFSRDDFVTYDDVHDIAYAIMIKRMQSTITQPFRRGSRWIIFDNRVTLHTTMTTRANTMVSTLSGS